MPDAQTVSTKKEKMEIPPQQCYHTKDKKARTTDAMPIVLNNFLSIKLFAKDLQL